MNQSSWIFARKSRPDLPVKAFAKVVKLGRKVMPPITTPLAIGRSTQDSQTKLLDLRHRHAVNIIVTRAFSTKGRSCLPAQVSCCSCSISSLVLCKMDGQSNVLMCQRIRKRCRRRPTSCAVHSLVEKRMWHDWRGRHPSYIAPKAPRKPPCWKLWFDIIWGSVALCHRMVF